MFSLESNIKAIYLIGALISKMMVRGVFGAHGYPVSPQAHYLSTANPTITAQTFPVVVVIALHRVKPVG